MTHADNGKASQRRECVASWRNKKGRDGLRTKEGARKRKEAEPRIGVMREDKEEKMWARIKKKSVGWDTRQNCLR